MRPRRSCCHIATCWLPAAVFPLVGGFLLARLSLSLEGGEGAGSSGGEGGWVSRETTWLFTRTLHRTAWEETPWCAHDGMRRAHQVTTEVFINKFKKELSTTKTPASLPKSFLNKAFGLDLEDSWGGENNTTLCSRNKYLKGRGEQGAVLVVLGALGALVRSRGVPSFLKARTRRLRSYNAKRFGPFRCRRCHPRQKTASEQVTTSRVIIIKKRQKDKWILKQEQMSGACRWSASDPRRILWISISSHSRKLTLTTLQRHHF